MSCHSHGATWNAGSGAASATGLACAYFLSFGSSCCALWFLGTKPLGCIDAVSAATVACGFSSAGGESPRTASHNFRCACHKTNKHCGTSCADSGVSSSSSLTHNSARMTGLCCSVGELYNESFNHKARNKASNTAFSSSCSSSLTSYSLRNSGTNRCRICCDAVNESARGYRTPSDTLVPGYNASSSGCNATS